MYRGNPPPAFWHPDWMAETEPVSSSDLAKCFQADPQVVASHVVGGAPSSTVNRIVHNSCASFVLIAVHHQVADSDTMLVKVFHFSPCQSPARFLTTS